MFSNKRQIVKDIKRLTKINESFIQDQLLSNQGSPKSCSRKFNSANKLIVDDPEVIMPEWLAKSCEKAVV